MVAPFVWRRDVFDLAMRDWDLNSQPKIMHKLNVRGRKLVTRESRMENKANVIVRHFLLFATRFILTRI